MNSIFHTGEEEEEEEEETDSSFYYEKRDSEEDNKKDDSPASEPVVEKLDVRVFVNYVDFIERIDDYIQHVGDW